MTAYCIQDDAIEAGAEEVELINEEELVAEFITGVNELNDVKENLEGISLKPLPIKNRN